jgi:hypothetical protein
MRIADKLIGPLVDLTSMADVVQIDPTLLHVKFVEDTVIAHSQLEFGAALKAIVRKIVETCAYLIHPALDGLTHRFR